ncbi:MAG: hypothetical protein ACE5HZ_01410 [Fidelibacterota bacterium]
MKLLTRMILLLALLSLEPVLGQLYFGRNKIQYHPFHWKVLSTPHFEIYYYPEEEELAATGAYFAEESFLDLEKKFNFTLGEKVPLIFYSSHLHFQQTNTTPYLIPEGVGGFFEFVKGRVVIPYQGSTAQFRQVIRHELVHVFMHHKIGQVLRIHNVLTYRSPPLWFTEGLAEFWSAGWDSKAEMVIRDALVNEYLVPLDRLDLAASGFLLYKEGQAFLRFIDQTYGHDAILLIMESVWKDSNFYTVMEEVLQEDFKDLVKEWKYSYKKDTYPLLQDRDMARMTTRKLTRKGVNASPVYYGQEGQEKVVFMTNRTGYSDIYMMNVDPTTDSEPEILVRGERTAEFESLHFLQSLLDVSDSGIMVFSSKAGAADVLNFFSLPDREVVYRFKDSRIVSISSPAWSPDGKRVVFSGLNWKGNQDLYLLTVEKGKLTRLTDDFYADRHPSFFPDGQKVIFSSDRGVFGVEGYFNLFMLDLTSGDILPVTSGRFNDLSPSWSPRKPYRLVFSSDRDGTHNLWIHRGIAPGSSDRTEGPIPLTHFLAGAFHPRWSGADGNDILFTAFEDYQFQVHLLENVRDLMDEHPPVSSPVVAERPSWFRSSLTGRSGKKSVPYRKEYSLDIAQTAMAYDPVFGFLGGAQITVSDLLGNDYYHFLLFNTAETSSEFLKRLNLAVTRVDLSRRINMAYGLFHFANDYYTFTDGFFFERRYGGQIALSYPLSSFRRVEVTSNLWKTERNAFLGESVFRAFLVSNSLSYVTDNSIWGPVGPVDGSSFRVTLGQTIDFSRSSIYYSGILADFRRYFRTSLSTQYALRLMTWLNRGRHVFRFYIGGSWGLRGFGRNEVAGQNFVLINNEFRFPFARQLVLRFSSFDLGISPIQGAVFLDMGNAWDRKPESMLGSFGVGLRGNLLGVIVLRLDVGKTTDFKTLSQGLFVQFFFGWNY